MTVLLVVFFFLLFPLVQSYTDESINLLVRSTTTSDIQRYCIELAKLPNDTTINIQTFGWHIPYLASSSVNACDRINLNNSLPNSFSVNTILVLYEHDCKITEHAWNVQQKYGENISLMIITNRTDTTYSLTYNVTVMPVKIPVLVIYQKDFNEIIDEYSNLNSVEFSIDYPVEMPKKFRPAIILMFLLVLIILLCGNFWAADEFKKKAHRPETTTHDNRLSNLNSTTVSVPVPVHERSLSQIVARRNSVAPSEIAKTDKEPGVLPITYCIVVLIIAFAVGWLLLLYYFPTVMIYILQVIFCIGAFSSLTSCFNRLSRFVPILRRYRIPSRQFHKPCVWKLGPLNVFTIFAMCISVTLVVIWYVYRHADWSWVLQDILGAAICMTITSIYRVGNMRMITIILIAFFLYDIFFVFVTPHIPIFQKSSNSSTTSTGSSSSGSSSTQTGTRQPSKNPSVMEQVALGMGANGEVVPLVFALPLLIPESEIDPCTAVRKTVLGFGDVILPGILLTFCKIFDIASHNRCPIYYIQSLISYSVGLIVTYIALYFMDTAQPALLYIVPCLLLSTIITSLFRRELKELYTGKRIEAYLEGKKLEPQPQGVNNSADQQTNGENYTVIA